MVNLINHLVNFRRRRLTFKTWKFHLAKWIPSLARASCSPWRAYRHRLQIRFPPIHLFIKHSYKTTILTQRKISSHQNTLSTWSIPIRRQSRRHRTQVKIGNRLLDKIIRCLLLRIFKKLRKFSVKRLVVWARVLEILVVRIARLGKRRRHYKKRHSSKCNTVKAKNVRIASHQSIRPTK